MPRTTYADVIGWLRDHVGEQVQMQMRSSAGGDTLTGRGQLAEPEEFADSAVAVALGQAVEARLHFDQQWEATISDDSTQLIYPGPSGTVFRFSLAGAV